MTAIDSTLADWSDVAVTGNYRAALLGNGFSISKHLGFDYPTLYGEAVESGALKAHSRNLFFVSVHD